MTELIKKLAERVEEEICDMRWYAQKACELKSTYPEIAESMYQISTQEESHAKILHERAEALITKHRDSGNSVPSDMLAVYEYIHNRALEKKEEAIRYQQMYKS